MDENEGKPTPLLDAVEAALSEIEGQPVPPFTVEVLHSCMAILAETGDYDETAPIDADLLVRAVMRAFYCGFQAAKTLGVQAYLDEVIRQD